MYHSLCVFCLSQYTQHMQCIHSIPDDGVLCVVVVDGFSVVDSCSIMSEDEYEGGVGAVVPGIAIV